MGSYADSSFQRKVALEKRVDVDLESLLRRVCVLSYNVEKCSRINERMFVDFESESALDGVFPSIFVCQNDNKSQL